MNISRLGFDFIRVKTFRDVIYLNCIKHFSVRRMLIALASVGATLILLTLTALFRIVDLVLYRDYRRMEIRDPIFIVSNPRSGTTYLQRLLSMDDRLVTLKMYHTLLPAISFYKLIDLISWFDQKLGSPLLWMTNKISQHFFAGWDDIHKAGINQPEEDEGIWFLAGLSPAWVMMTPYVKSFRDLSILDDFPEKDRKRMGRMYLDFLKRFKYLYPQKRLMVKSVMSAGRIHLIKEVFPTALIISTNRSSMDTIPSYISMFSTPWRLHSPKPSVRMLHDLGLPAIDLNNHLVKYKKESNVDECLDINYQSLISNTMAEIRNVYQFLDLSFDEELEMKFEAMVRKRRTYSSKHRYQLEDFGYTIESLEALILK